MGRVAELTEVVHGGEQTYIWANQLRADYARRLQVPASYTISKQDGVCYADHCFGTGTDYSGATDSTVIQNANDALTNGGRILFKAGSYSLTNQVQIKYNSIKWEGEGFWNTTIAVNFDGYGINISNATADARIREIGLKDFTLRSQYVDNRHGLWIEGAQRMEISSILFWQLDDCITFSMNNANRPNRGGVFLHDLLLEEFKGTGICDDGSTASTSEIMMRNMFISGGSKTPQNGIVFAKDNIFHIHDVSIGKMSSYGLNIQNTYASAFQVWVENCLTNIISGDRFKVSNSIFTDMQRDCLRIKDASHAKITHNDFIDGSQESQDSYVGLELENVTQSKINGNDAYDNGANYADRFQYCGIRESGTSDYNRIYRNDVAHNRQYLIVKAGANTLIEKNKGFVTENYGTATIGNGTETTGNIAHGLSGTPTVVFAMGSTSDTEDLYCDSKDATNIVIKTVGAVGGDRTIYWRAKYKP